MITGLVLGLSILLQFTAAYLAFRLIELTGKRLAWTLIALALALMGARSSITGYWLLAGDSALSPDLTAELVALAISILTVAGMAGIKPIFVAIRDKAKGLRESEARLKAIIDNSPAAIFLKDRDGGFDLMSRSFAQLCGIDPETVRGKTVHDLFPADMADRFVSQDREVRERREAVEYEFVWPTPGGDRVFAAVKFPILDASGELVGFGGIDHDITERTRAEAALKESEQRLRLITDALPVLIVYFDTDQRYRFVNKTHGRWHGLDPEQVIGAHLKDVVGPATYDVLRPHLEAALSGREVSFEVEFKFPRVGRRYVHTSYVPHFGKDGEVEGVYGLVLDLTEHKAAETRFQTLLEAAPDAMVVVDEAGKIVLVSAQTERLFGYAREELLGNSVERLIPERFRAGHAARQKGFFADPHPRPVGTGLVLYGRTKEGAEVPIEISLSPIETEKGMQVLAAIRDVSERKRAEEALRRSEQRFRDVIEAVEEVIWETDVTGRFTFFSDNAREVFAIPPSAFLGKTPLDTVVPEQRDDIRPRLRAAFQARIPFKDLEYLIARPDRQPVWVSVSGSPVLSTDGTLRGYCGTVRDITERKQAEEAFRTSEERFKAMLDYSPSAIYLKDTEGRFILVNRRYERQFDLGLAEVRGKTAHDLFPAELADTWVLHDREVIDKATVVEREFSMSYADGTPHTFIATKFPILDPDGTVVAVGGINTDITERKAAEEQLRQAQKMEAVGQLTGGVAHDFNNILAIALGNLQLLEMSLNGDEEQRDLTARAVDAVRRGASLTQRLLAFSRRQVLQPRLTDLKALVGGMLDLLRRTLGETIEIETALTGEDCHALVDPGQLENALLNLALNARDAMPRGGRLRIEVTKALLGEDHAASPGEMAGGDYVVLAVSDTGSGMSPNALEHAFEPFYTTKEVGQGSGLGLSMVYGFVKQSGGEVTLESEEDRGTLVTIYLPHVAVDRPAAEEAPAARPVPQGKGETILVVEDDSGVRRMAVSALTSLGYRAVCRADGEAALALLERTPEVALLFTDVVLPGGTSGGELAREARRRWPALKVLCTSGYTKEAIGHHGRLDEDIELLWKPYEHDELARTMRAVLDGE